jgi:hypothetical protein
MPIIKSQNSEYSGVTAGVKFSAGKGETSDPWLLEWFREHGYLVETEPIAVEEPEEHKEEGVKSDGVHTNERDADKPGSVAGNKRRKPRRSADTASDPDRDQST